MPNDAVQERLVGFLQAGGADLLDDDELNCVFVVLDDDDDVADDNDVAENSDLSIGLIMARINTLREAGY